MSLHLKPVDRDSVVTLYNQVKQQLRSSIQQGVVSPGDRLPSEAQLCDMLQVSRTVIRQALDDLAHEGLLVKEQGRGTFVAESKIGEGLVQKLTGFYQDMIDRGYEPATQVLRQEVMSASPLIASYLHIEPRTPVIVIERLRFVNHEPIALVTTFIPYDRCPDLLYRDLTRQSLYHLLENEFDLVIHRGHRTIEAVLAGEREAGLLQIQSGDPLVLLNSVSYLGDETPIEYYRALHRGDRSRFEVELVRVWGAEDADDTLDDTERR